jgi:chromosome partitioning protein
MAAVAIYSLKGGVGKTTLAVNLAWCAAALSARRTLLWDLDPQAASTFLLGNRKNFSEDAQSVFAREIAPSALIRPTATPRLDLLPADISLRGLDRFFFGLSKKKRLARLIESLAGDYDRMILDCPPGLTETSEQIIRAAAVIVVPVIPSPLSMRALDDVIVHLDRHHQRIAPVVPVFNMVDRRRAVHLAALADRPDWPAIPMASAIETMAVRCEPIGAFASTSPGTAAFARLWTAIERRLTT